MNDLKIVHNEQKIKKNKNKKSKINNTKCDENPTRIINTDTDHYINTSSTTESDQIHKNKLNFALKESIKKNKWFYLTLLV